MGQPLSVDLRERVVALVAAGYSRRAAARHFAVGNSSAIRLTHRVAASGSCEFDQQGRPPGSGKLAPYTAFLISAVETQPDITMPELRDQLVAAHGIGAEPAVLSRFRCRHGFTYKKSLDGGGARTRRRGRGAP